MPTLNLTTNVPGDRVSASQIIADLSKVVASSVGKPEAYVMVSLRTDVPMCYAGNEEPCAYAELVSIGGFRGKQADISAAVMATVEKHLGVSPSRFYINFVGVQGSDFGWKSATF